MSASQTARNKRYKEVNGKCENCGCQTQIKGNLCNIDNYKDEYILVHLGDNDSVVIENKNE